MNRPSVRQDVLLVGFCVCTAIIVTVIPWLFNRRFYFHDDIQHWYMPLFYHIGHVLRAGEIPFISLANFTTSNLLGEYQTGLFNPFLLALYWVLPSINNMETAGLFFVGANMAVLGGGLYVLARSYGTAPQLAVIFAAAILSNNMLCYWYAGSWFSLLYSASWMVWAWAALNRAEQSRWWALSAALFTYLTLTAGFPNVSLLVGLISIVTAFQKRKEAGSWRGAAPVLLAITAGGLLSSIPLLALVSMQAVSIRSSATFNTGFLVPDLRDVLAFSSPFHRGLIHIFGGYRALATPIFYCSWVAAPVLALMDWRRDVLKTPAVVTTLVIAGGLLLATQGPEQIHTLRWPFRWLPYFHMALLLSILVLLQRQGFAKNLRRRLRLVIGIIALQFLFSFQAFPPDTLLNLAGAVTCGIGVYLFVRFRHMPMLQSAVGVGVTLLLFIATHLVYPVNRDLPDRGISSEPGRSYGAEVPGAYAVYLGNFGNEGDPSRLGEYTTGLIPLSQGVPMLNGYTPLGHRSLAQFLCMDIFGVVCPSAGPQLLSADPETGVHLVDLFRIDRLTVMRGQHLDAIAPLLDESWVLQSEGTYTRQFVRQLPNANLPGSLSWVSPGLTVASAGDPAFMSESVQVTVGDQPGSLVFARLFWPGYRAFLGDQEIAVDAYRGIFVRVQVPAGAEGEVVLRFLPPPRLLGLAATAVGAMLLIFLVTFHRLLPGSEAPQGNRRLREGVPSLSSTD